MRRKHGTADRLDVAREFAWDDCDKQFGGPNDATACRVGATHMERHARRLKRGGRR